MRTLLSALGLQTKEIEISPEQCQNLVPGAAAQEELVRALVTRSSPPVVCLCEGGGYLAVSGAHLLSAAGRSTPVPGYAVVENLSPGVVEFLLALGNLYDAQPLHPVLAAQALWTFYSWSNAQAAYMQRQKAGDPPLVSPLVFTQAATTIDDVDEAVEKYLSTYFAPLSRTEAGSWRHVWMPWAQVLSLFPLPPSETKRKVLLRLLDSIPRTRRAAFRNVHAPLSLLQRLAAVPAEFQDRVLDMLAQTPAEKHREILRQAVQPPRAAGIPLPADAYPADTPSMFFGIVRALNRANALLRSLQKLTPKQQQQLWQLLYQQWELLERLE